MPVYRVSVTAQLESAFTLDMGRLRLASNASSAKLISHDMVHVVLSRRGSNASCAADRAVVDLSRALGPQTRFTRPPVWQARRKGLLGLGARVAGRWSLGDDDDGLGGVREPRRPIPPAGHAAVALDPPAA
jgi:hypothetical protein